MANHKYLLPAKIEQKIIVDEINVKMQILEGLLQMKTEAETKISKILADVWGVEIAEPVKVEVEDEQED